MLLGPEFEYLRPTSTNSPTTSTRSGKKEKGKKKRKRKRRRRKEERAERANGRGMERLLIVLSVLFLRKEKVKKIEIKKKHTTD